MFLRVSRSNASLVDSLFPPERVFALEVIQTFTAQELARKQKTETNSKQSINKGAASGEWRPPPLHLDSPVPDPKPFTGCRVKIHAENSRCNGTGGWVDAEGAACLTSATPLLLYTPFPRS